MLCVVLMLIVGTGLAAMDPLETLFVPCGLSGNILCESGFIERRREPICGQALHSSLVICLGVNRSLHLP